MLLTEGFLLDGEIDILAWMTKQRPPDSTDIIYITQLGLPEYYQKRGL